MPTVLVLALALPVGCDKDDTKGSDPAAQAPTPPATVSPSHSSAAARLPAIALPDAVPESAAGVLVLRTPESLFATIAGFDLFGEPEAGDTKALREELDAYLESSIGMTLTEVDTVTVFLLADAGVAAIIEGAQGTPKGRVVGEHEGVSLLALGKASEDEAVAAQHGKLLLVGQPAAVKLALSAAAGKAPRLEKGPLVELLTDHSEGVALAAVVETARLPKDLREPADAVGVERAAIHYGARGLRVVAMGPESAMQALQGQATMGLDLLVKEAERAKTEALAGDDTLEGVGAIYGHHSARRLRAMLEPKLDGNRLGLELPVAIRDPAVLAAVAGVAAAIAIPALTKYMRRSKTSEARVQIAKMFDAASVYFNEEHVSRGAVEILGGGTLSAVAPHQCPNDGRTEGSAGLTPPASVDCNEGPGGRCVPVVGEPTRPGEYSMELWTGNPVWSALNFQMEQGHYFHYDFRWNNQTSGFGACQFTAQAFGDLDDDGVMSTYERSGAADEMGVNAAAGLYIDREVE